MSELEKMTLVELKALAKENNIKNISKLKKDELIEILNKVIISSKKEETNRSVSSTLPSFTITNSQCKYVCWSKLKIARLIKAAWL